MIRIEQAHLPVVALTHPGMSGKNNEDRFAVSAYQISASNPTPVLVAVLSDGIGGHQSGEVAAEIAVNAISQEVAESDARQPLNTLLNAVTKASLAISTQAKEDKERYGMGATCAIAWVIGSQLYTATVGDSRIYLLRGDRIRQLSVDHTWVQEALDMGVIEPDQADGHPNMHIIQQYLGSPTPAAADLRLRLEWNESDAQAEVNQGMTLQDGDRLLLCSDGLTDLVANEEILAAFEEGSMESSSQSLIDLANKRGGHDNITLITIGKGERAPRIEEDIDERKATLVYLSVLVLGALIGAIVLGLMWYMS